MSMTITRVAHKTARITFSNPTNTTSTIVKLHAKPVQVSASTLLVLRVDGTYTVYTHLPNGLVVMKGFTYSNGLWSGPHKKYADALTAFSASHPGLFFTLPRNQRWPPGYRQRLILFQESCLLPTSDA